jgi:PAS domain S-box-containing protein
MSPDQGGACSIIAIKALMTEITLKDTIRTGGDNAGLRSNASIVGFKRVAWVATLLVIAIGVLDIIGTILNITLLTSVTAHWIRMRIIAAVCFVLSGLELALLMKRPAAVGKRMALQVPGIMVGMAGFLTILLYAIRMITGQDWSIGNVPFFHLFWDAETRIALITAIIFLMISCGLAAMARSSSRGAAIAHGIVLPAAIVSYFVPVSYLLGVESIHNILGTPAAMNTGIAFCLLCTGIFCARTDTWLMRVFAAGGVGGYMARRLLPAILLIPVVIACVHEYGKQSGAFGHEALPALLAVLSTVLLVWFVWLTAKFVSPADANTHLPADGVSPRKMSVGGSGASRLVKYVYALLAAPLAVLLRMALMPLLGPGVQYITIYAVTASVAVLGGLGPAVVASLLGAILTDYFFIEPLHVLDINIPFISQTAVVVMTSAFVGYVGDMLRAARAKAESQAEALRESREYLSTVVRASPAGIFVTRETDGLFIEANDAYLNVIGYSAEEVVKHTSLELDIWVDPEDRKKVVKALRQNQHIENNEIRLRHKSGRIVDLLYSARPFELAGEKCILGTLTDITERKRDEAALHIASSRAQILSETAGQLLESRNPQEIVNSLCHKVMKHMDCHIFVNYLVDEKMHRLHLNASGGLSDRMAKAIQWLDFGEAICGRVAQEGRRIVAENIQESCDRRADLVRSLGIRAYACHPIMTQGRVVGTLSFGTSSRPGFTEDNLALMKTVTDQVAVALERISNQKALQTANEELEQRVQERTSELRGEIAERRKAEMAVTRHLARQKRLLEVSERIMQQTALDVLLNTISEEARELCGARYVSTGHGYVNGNFITGGASRSPEAMPCPPGQVFSVEKGGVYMDLIEKQETIRLTDAQMRAHPAWWGLPPDHVPMRGLLGARLNNAMGESNGILMVSDKEDGSDFTEEDETALKQLAAIASLGLQHIVARTLAEQKAIEQEQSSRYARSLLESSLDPLVTISVDGKITDVNEATIKVTGIDREELVGTDFSNYFTEPRKAREGYQRAFADGFVTDYPLTIRHRGGPLTDVLYNASVYKDMHGNIAGVFAAARDITDRKLAEAELERYRVHLEELVRQRTEDLTRSNEDLEQFAYVASHDLQEPLRAVAGFIELLRRRMSSALDSKAAEYMDFAVDGAKRMQSLINGLLEYSRAGQDQKNAAMNARAALDMAVAYLRKTIEESGANVASDELPVVHFDSTQLTQVFQNLIGNAIKFRGNETPRIQIGATKEDGGWQFSVRDNGIGFEPEYAERIFLIFQRLHGRDNYKGTGIGLAICKKIIERHKGRIWAASKPGEGSTFYFTIPDLQQSRNNLTDSAD